MGAIMDSAFATASTLPLLSAGKQSLTRAVLIATMPPPPRASPMRNTMSACTLHDHAQPRLATTYRAMQTSSGLRRPYFSLRGPTTTVPTAKKA